MTFREDWTKERDANRAARAAKSFARRMQSPVPRGEVFQLGEAQMQHLASLALAIEALEDILVGRGVLDRDELMDTMYTMAAAKADIAVAAHCTAGTAQV